MSVADRSSLPIATSISSASLHKITLVKATLSPRFTKRLPEHLIGDRAYGHDPLDEKLAENGVELIDPHHANRKKEKSRNARKFRRDRS